ncbi:cytochrome P450 [Streptomyces sp. SCA3-4]|uniref:cytochrome P450 family protein n=1 Tax=Streptomyces sichuanensis TaxID=2871810 RepID=UPI001CE34722|nr:cytochrome P450 [Streptomyces sichuanensis]MCA6091932.1 cytochrome P450 [Streptomyces sichuanensis]
MSQTDVPESGMFTPEFDADPYSVYGPLREKSPVTRVKRPDGTEVWWITRHKEAREALADDRLSKDMRQAGDLYLAVFGESEESAMALDQNMINCDPPDHTRLRRLVAKAFTAPRVERLRPRIEELVDELLDGLDPHGRTDFLQEFGYPLTVSVICELLGIPAEDRGSLREWSSKLGAAGFTEEGREAAGAAQKQLNAYLRALIARRRDEPADGLLDALIAVRDEGDSLTEDELVSTVFLLMFAGHESTALQIANSMLTLLREPGRYQALREHPEKVDAVVEECLRYDGSAEVATFRFAREDIEIGDVTIPRGSMVTIVIAAANRDPRQFSDPEVFDAERGHSGHLSFGHGRHYCIGASLARLELRAALHGILRRFPAPALDVTWDELHFLPGGLAFRGLRSLPVRLSPPAPAGPGGHGAEVPA